MSAYAGGLRASEVIRAAREREIVPDLALGLYVAAETLGALRALHARSCPHGALALERLVVTPDGSVVVADYLFAEALGALRFSPHRLWRELGLVVHNGDAPFTPEADVRQTALVALAFIIGRPLDAGDRAAVEAAVSEATEAALIRGGRRLADPLATWFRRALACGSPRGYADADAAATACESLLGAGERAAAPSALAELLVQILVPQEPARAAAGAAEPAAPIAVSSAEASEPTTEPSELVIGQADEPLPLAERSGAAAEAETSPTRFLPPALDLPPAAGDAFESTLERLEPMEAVPADPSVRPGDAEWYENEPLPAIARLEISGPALHETQAPAGETAGAEAAREPSVEAVPVAGKERIGAETPEVSVPPLAAMSGETTVERAVAEPTAEEPAAKPVTPSRARHGLRQAIDASRRLLRRVQRERHAAPAEPTLEPAMPGDVAEPSSVPVDARPAAGSPLGLREALREARTSRAERAEPSDDQPITLAPAARDRTGETEPAAPVFGEPGVFDEPEAASEPAAPQSPVMGEAALQDAATAAATAPEPSKAPAADEPSRAEDAVPAAIAEAVKALEAIAAKAIQEAIAAQTSRVPAPPVAREAERTSAPAPPLEPVAAPRPPAESPEEAALPPSALSAPAAPDLDPSAYPDIVPWAPLPLTPSAAAPAPPAASAEAPPAGPSTAAPLVDALSTPAVPSTTVRDAPSVPSPPTWAPPLPVAGAAESHPRAVPSPGAPPAGSGVTVPSQPPSPPPLWSSPPPPPAGVEASPPVWSAPPQAVATPGATPVMSAPSTPSAEPPLWASPPPVSSPLRLKESVHTPGARSTASSSAPSLRLKEQEAERRPRQPSPPLFATPVEIRRPSRLRHARKLAVAAVFLLVAALVAATVPWPSGSKAPAPGTLVLESTPPGGEVTIDGRRRGETPLKLELAPGRYEVTVSGRGRSRTLAVEIASGAEVVRRVDLAPERAPVTGSLEIVSQPSGARVLIDGRVRGQTPLLVDELAAGRHVVLVESGSGAVRRTVRVRPGETTRVEVSIYSGFLRVTAPLELEVFADGKGIGFAGGEPLLLPPGRHTVELVNELLGYRSTHVVDVAPGEEERIVVRPLGTLNVNALPWAEVWVDGERLGETPIANAAVPLGTREVRFRHPQYGERRVTVTVKAGTPAQATVDFTR